MFRSCNQAAHVVSGLLLIAMLFFAPLNSLSAATAISNTPNTVTGGSTISNTDYKAILFTTGSYTSYITSLILGLNPLSPSDPPITGALNISLWSATSDASEYKPDTQLAITGTQSVTINATKNLYTFDGIFGSGFSMAANTPYALVLSSDANQLKWGRNNTGSMTTGEGFTFHSFNLSTDSGANWTTLNISQDNAIVMEVGVVPEPSTALMSLVLLGGATIFLLLSKRRGTA